MALSFGRYLAPAAAPLGLRELANGMRGAAAGAGEVERRRAEIARLFGTAHCFLVSSGRAALTLLLLALKDLNPARDRVLIPAFTCFSVPAAILRAGLQPVLCDIDEDSLDFDYRQLERRLADPRLLCVVPTHLFGMRADILRLRRLLAGRGVAVVEDAAQGMGLRSRGRLLGTLGDAAFFSLGRGKALTTVEGGIILTRDDKLGAGLASRIQEIPGYGPGGVLKLLLGAVALTIFLRPHLYRLPASLPFLGLGSSPFEPGFALRRMSPFQAGLMKDWQLNLARLQQGRRDHCRYWMEALPGHRPAGAPAARDAALLRYPLLLQGAEGCRELAVRGRHLGVARTYPDAVSGIPGLGERFAGEDYPVARRAARQLVTLPVHAFVTRRDRVRILELLNGLPRREPLPAGAPGLPVVNAKRQL